MAGIGFELRRLLRSESIIDYVRAYGYAGLISSGPWVFSLVSVLVIGSFSAKVVQPRELVQQFLLSVTYQMAGSLILTSPLQLMFSRFIADRVYAKREGTILPNVMGALLVTSCVSGIFASLVVATLFPPGPTYKVLLVGSFVTLCDSWIVIVLLGGLKAYQRVLGAFFVGNSISIVGSLSLRPWGLEGLLLGFWMGQAVMTFGLLALVARDYPSDEQVSFEFLSPKHSLYSLAFIGLFYNAGIWADKLIFWANPATSEPVLGPMRSSMIYDLPIFLAYLSIAPGMAVFLMRIETDFAEAYSQFYAAIKNGATLSDIEELKIDMVTAVRQGLYDILKIQGVTIVAAVLAGPALLHAFGISLLYQPLLNVDVVGVGVQVLLLSVLSVLFYLDKRMASLIVTGLFAVLNVGLTLLSQRLGPEFFGYGFAVSALIASMVGLTILSRRFERLEYETFMSQR